MKKLTIEHLAGYLPYKLKGYSEKKVIKLITGGFIPQKHTLSVTNVGDLYAEQMLHLVKPILHPLSDLTRRELRKQGFTTHIDYLTVEKLNPINAPYEMVVYLFSKHFDIFGLIESGLAIDINTI